MKRASPYVGAEPKVHEFGVYPLTTLQQDVLKLDVTVHNIKSVHVLHLF